MEKKSMILKNKLNLVELSKNEMKSVIGGMIGFIPIFVTPEGPGGGGGGGISPNCACACVCGTQKYGTANKTSGNWGMKSGF